MSGEVMNLLIEEIDVSSSHRHVNSETVQRLAASFKEIGLQHPITVRSNKATSRFDLIAGRHRLEAARAAKWDRLACRIVKMDDDEARMWEISENLHRAELSTLERSEQIAEYAELAKRRRALVSAQVAQKAPHRPEGGDSAASRDLGLSRDDIRRSQKIAAIAREAKEIAREAGLEDNQSKLLQIAKAETPAQQSEIARRFSAAPKAPKVAADPLTDELAAEKQVARLMDAWNAAGPEARAEFLLRIDQPIMDRRFA